MNLRLVAAFCVVTVSGIGVIGGCSSTSTPPAATSSSTVSTTATSTSVAAPDPHVAAVNACRTFEAVWAPVANAEYAVYNDEKSHAPQDVGIADTKKIISAGQDATAKLQSVLTPDVPNPPASALRAWLDALGTEINSDPNAAPPNDFASNQDREQKAALAADDTCKQFS